MKKGKNGFTIIELVMVIVILALIAGIGITIAMQLAESFQYSLFRKGISGGADAALVRMSREIRRIKDSASVTTANSTSYGFVDIDGNTRQFTLNGTNLERNDGTNTDILLPDISAFVFTYLDGSLSPIATPLVSPNATDIRFVQVDTTVSSGGNTINYSQRIRLHRLNSLSDFFP